MISDQSANNKKKCVALVSVAIIVLSLAFMKYASVYGNDQSIVLPVGMSFYCFRNISYLTDVYRGMLPDHDIVHYLNYSIFFPAFTSGPIDRYSDLSLQLSAPMDGFDYDMASRGMIRFLAGLFKKSVVAGHMALYTGWVYGDIRSYSGFTLLLTSFFYTIQIYCDFSGYSDMAIGLSELLGFKIKDNFKHPYLSESLSDFWERWHISLSTWLRDYIYIPLGGNRKGKPRKCVNLLITFLVSGIWHGASLNFLVWGGVHGIVSVGESCLSVRKSKNRYVKRIRQAIMFVFINFTWVVFRLTKMTDIGYFFIHILDGLGNLSEYIMSTQRILHIDYIALIRLIAVIGMVFIYDYCDERWDVADRFANLASRYKMLIYTAVMLVLYMLLPVEAATEYIYCRF